MKGPGWDHDLQACAKLIDEELRSFLADIQPPALGAACRHYPDAGGKRLRPAITMMACEAAGGVRQDAVRPALAVELIHVFSLIHDDIMDRDETRRGRPSVHVLFGEPIAILAGDAVFAKAFTAIESFGGQSSQRNSMWAELAEASLRLSEGQAKDMELQISTSATVEDYLDMIYGKTGRLYEASAVLGAIAAGASPEVVHAMREYGKALGQAFQIRDDVLGLTASPEKLGKPWGSDIRNGKRTIVLLHAQKRAKSKDAEILRAHVGNLDASISDVQVVVEVFERTGALDFAQETAAAAAEKAASVLSSIAQSAARTTLGSLARFSVERDR